MRGKRLLLLSAGIALGLGSATPSTVAWADDFWDMMNPAWWMGLDDDDDDWHYRRHRYGRYGWDAPWGPYGWGGYPGHFGRTIVIAQRADKPRPEPEPKLPE